MSTPVEVAKQLFASFVLGDEEGLLAVAHPAGRWFFPGDPEVLPWAGWWDGRDLGRFLDVCKSTLDYLDYTVDEFIPAEGNRVVVVARETCRCKATGKVFHNRHMGVLHVVDGQVMEWVEAADTSAMHAAFADG